MSTLYGSRRDRRRHQHGHQEGHRGDDRRRLSPKSARACRPARRLCSRQRRPLQLQHQLRPASTPRASTVVPARFTPQGGYVDLDGYRNINVGVAAGLRHQRQHPAHLVQPLHRQPREIRPGRPGRSQRHGVHAAVLQSPAVRRQLLQRPWKPTWASATAPSIATTWTTRASRSRRTSLLPFPEFHFQRPDVSRPTGRTSSSSASSSTSWAASISTSSGPIPTPTSIMSFPCTIRSWRTGAPPRRPASTARSAATLSAR